MFRPFPSAYLIDLSISRGLHSIEHWMHSSDASGACKHHAQRTRPELIAKCSPSTRLLAYVAQLASQITVSHKQH